MNLNLSALAVRERAVTLFFIMLLAAAGVYAFVKLGRAEDPSFTIKTLTLNLIAMVLFVVVAFFSLRASLKRQLQKV